MAATLSIRLILNFFFVCISFHTTHTNDPKNNGLRVRMMYRDSPESPIYQPNLTTEERMDKLIQISDARLKFRTNHERSRKSANNQNELIRPPMYGAYNVLYMVEVGIGTFQTNPAYKKEYLLLDTGNDVTWTQCEGCNPFFHQNTPYFPRSESRIYQALPCTQCPKGSTCEQCRCSISLSYEDGSFVAGIAAKETFTFQSGSASEFKINDLVFSCVIRSENFHLGDEPSNSVSGIIGLGRDTYSFVRQIESQIKGRFSYCLQPLDSQGGRSPMFLRYGDDIPQLGWIHRQRTPLLNGPKGVYYLDLRGVNVGKMKLPIKPEVFHIQPDGSGGTYIDSGTAISYLVQRTYDVLQDIEAHNPYLRRISSPLQNYRLCYEKTRPNAKPLLPKIKLHFANNADFVLEGRTYFKPLSSNPGQLCLMILPKSDTVLGAMQQVDHRIVYDLQKSQLIFAQKDCSSSN